MTNPVAPQAVDADAAPPAPPFDPAIVDGLLGQLDKTLRAHQLYNANNPTYIKTLETMRAAFAPLWVETDTLTLQVSDTEFSWFGTPVHVQDGKASDSLPWTLYKDGVRELTFTPGFEGAELDKLLDILPRARKAGPGDDDLLTMLWEQEFDHLAYRYVELASEGVPIDPAASQGMWPVTAGQVVEEPFRAIEDAQRAQQADASGVAAADGHGGSAPTAARPAGVVSMEDFDSALYFLEEDEIRYLKTELSAEYDTDLRRVVLDSLFDIFELQVDALVRKEVVAHIDALTLHLLAGRQFATVAYLLRESSTARNSSPPVRTTRPQGAISRCSTLATFLQILLVILLSSVPFLRLEYFNHYWLGIFLLLFVPRLDSGCALVLSCIVNSRTVLSATITTLSVLCCGI